MSPARRAGVALALAVVAAALRVPTAGRPALWADEIFSLAMATGHSLEHPAAEADPALGDFVEWPDPAPAGDYGRYLRHDRPPAGPDRVIRAVLHSDTSPPFYYLLLYAWTRVAGTGDASLRLFSVLAALAAFPLLWLFARRIGGRRAAAAACALYAVAPVSLYYSGEGRMYALLWLLALGFGWLTLRLHDRGARPAPLLLWTAAGAAGLLTHYFFAFVWAAGLLWLLLHPGRAARGAVAGAVLLALLAIFPWYRLVPESLGRWRITGTWLDVPLSPSQAVRAPFALAWSLLSGRGAWGGIKWLDRSGALLFVALGVAAVVAGGIRPFLAPRIRLLWLWAAAACLGPVVFDLWRGTYTSLVPRYALAGMPAAMLLAGFAASRLPPRWALGFLGLIVASWLPPIRTVLAARSRSWEPYREVAARAEAWVGPADLVVVHSIPSGVLGVARYLRPDLPVAAWIGQLGRRRVPDDVRALVRGRRRVALIRIHEVGEAAPEADWLREHARLVRDDPVENSHVLYFEAVADVAAGTTTGPPPTRR